MVENVSLNDNNLNLIRNNAEKLTIQSDLRRKIIGGISEEDVSKYIDNVRQQFQLVEDELKENISEIQASKDEIKREFESYMRRSVEEKTKLQEDLENALVDKDTTMLMQRISILEETLNQTQSKLEEEHKIREQLEHELKIKIDENTAYCKANKSMEKQLKSAQANAEKVQEEKSNMNSNVMGFKSEIESIYKQLNTLNDMAIENNNLQRQLELEHLRADKAEKELSQLVEMVSSLKDRSNNNQKQLKTQIAEIEKMQKVIYSNISGVNTNLENLYIDLDTKIDNLCSTFGEYKSIA